MEFRLSTMSRLLRLTYDNLTISDKLSILSIQIQAFLGKPVASTENCLAIIGFFIPGLKVTCDDSLLIVNIPIGFTGVRGVLSLFLMSVFAALTRVTSSPTATGEKWVAELR
jgi:hypothetical protein